MRLVKLEGIEFGDFKEIEPQIMEVIIHEGVVLDADKIQMIEEGLLEKYSNRYALLVNRINHYSHTHESMMKVSRLKNLVGIAILVYEDFAKQVAAIHELYQRNVAVFDDRKKAITWLRSLLKEASTEL
jgi:hypothetical protein